MVTLERELRTLEGVRRVTREAYGVEVEGEVERALTAREDLEWSPIQMRTVVFRASQKELFQDFKELEERKELILPPYLE